MMKRMMACCPAIAFSLLTAISPAATAQTLTVDAGKVLCRVEPFSPLGEWNKLRVIIDGAKLRVWLNDSLIKTYEDADSPLESGYVGLRSFGGSATFRNLKIDGRDIRFVSDAPGVSGMW